MRIRLSALIRVTSLTLLLTACGGGGSGSPTDGDEGDTDEPPVEFPEDTADPLSYNGADGAVALSRSNVAVLLFNILGRENGLTDPLETDAAGNAGLDQPATARRRPSYAAEPVSGGELAAGDLSESIRDCDRGTYRRVRDFSTRKTVIEYLDCTLDGLTRDGVVTLTHSDSNSRRISFRRLAVTRGERRIESSGSITVTEERGGDRVVRAVELVVRYANGKRVRADYQEELHYFSPVHKKLRGKTITGRIYDSDHGYIDIETTVPLTKNPESPGFSPYTGQLVLTGDESEAVVGLKGKTVAWIQLDVDGDKEAEHDAHVHLGRLLSDENASIKDTDGDGMHDSWESANGLNPFDAGDAGSDADGDGADNLTEYRRGTPANEAGPEPKMSNLELSLNERSDSVFPVGQDVKLIYFLENKGPHTAEYATVEFRLPEGFEPVSVPGYRCHTVHRTITCAYEQIEPDDKWSIELTVRLSDTPGDYSITHSLYSDVLDAAGEDSVDDVAIGVQPKTVELAVNLSDSADPVATGNYFDYVIEITNNGAITAEDVEAVFTLPADMSFDRIGYLCDDNGVTLTCTIDSLRPHTTQTIVHTVLTDGGVGSTAEASITVTPDGTELNTTDNNDTESTEIDAPVADASFNRENAYWLNAESGSQWAMVISARNHGPDRLNEMRITLDLPPEVTVVDTSAYGGLCGNGAPPECWSDERPAGGAFTVEYELTSSTPGIYPVTATVSHDHTDPDPSNNSYTRSVFVGEPVDGIEQAIEAAADGETVTVAPGYYYGDLRYENKRIHLTSSDGPEVTFISPSTFGVNPGPGGELSGFSFTHSKSVVRLSNDEPFTVHNNVFDMLTDTFGSAIFTGGSATATIERNVFRDSVCRGRGTVIEIGGSAGPVIRNNLFVGNSDCAGIHDRAVDPVSPVVINNTFVSNGIALQLRGSVMGAGALYANNIIYGNDVGIETTTDCGSSCTIFQSNLLFNNTTDYADSQDQTGTNGNIAADPLFTDPASGDYSLQAGSPAIDAGNPAQAPDGDLTGNPRPVDGDASGTPEPDIGAYERQ